MEEQLAKIRLSANEELKNITTKEELEAFRVSFLGKKGKLTEVLRGMGKLSSEERPVIGQLANEVRLFIEQEIEVFSNKLEEKELLATMAAEKIDVTMPGKRSELGKKHPMTIVLDQIKDIFIGMGFEIGEGPEIDTVYYNFDALNAPDNHPSRDMQDTFYITDDVLLRTQTSTVQIHAMQNKKPPIRMIAPGRVYRNDAVDATHSPVFHQMEGLVIDKGVTMSDLKGTLEVFCKELYGDSTKVRFRPHHFPFTEPSAELDVSCPACNGTGCRVCKGEGWVEILGAGMVHPNVLKNCGIDPDVYSGFAFGLGLERIVMRKYDIDDLRLFFENDLRFLKQF